VNTYLKGRKITAAQEYERPSMEALRLIRKIDGLEWRKKRSGSKRNYMKAHWLAVSSRLRTKLTRSTVQKSASTDGHACSQWCAGGVAENEWGKGLARD
jgi:hypothetical protein